MITEKEAHELLNTLFDLRKKAKDNPSEAKALKMHENKCIEDFKYLVLMKTSRYKAFNNYEDLNQDGYEALLRAIETFDNSKGSFFAWAHHYIGTRISRKANLHTTIRFPLKFSKETAPHKETQLPTLIEDKRCPDKEYEFKEKVKIINSAFTSLTELQKNVIMSAYGFDEVKPLSVDKLCKKFKLSKQNVLHTIKVSLETMKNNNLKHKNINLD